MDGTGHTLYYAVMLILVFPWLYSLTFLIKMVVRTYGYLKIFTLIALYMLFAAFCVLLVSSGHIALPVLLVCVVQISGLLRFKHDFASEVKDSVKKTLEVLGLSAE